MLIFENSITHEIADGWLLYLKKRLDSGRYKKVGPRIINVPGGLRGTTYVYMLNGQPVAWLFLRVRSNWVAHEVKHIWVTPECRGLGLAKKLYKAAINLDGKLVASGITQTRWARELWKGFVRDSTFNIWAHNLTDDSQFSDVVYDRENDELWSKLELYTRDKSRFRLNDVRLIAARKQPNVNPIRRAQHAHTVRH